MNHKNKIYIIILIFLLIIFILVFFLILPSLRDIRNFSKEILLNKSKVMLIDEKIKELDSFKINYENYKYNLEKINKLFINSENPIDFVKFLESISLQSGIVSDINLIPSQKKREDNFSIIVFQITVNGNILNVLKFIEKLEKGPYLLEIQKVTVKNSLKNTSQKESIHNFVEANFLVEAITE